MQGRETGWDAIAILVATVCWSVVVPRLAAGDESAGTFAPAALSKKSQDTEPSGDAPTSHDVVIYGGTSGAVVAAVRAKHAGASVIVVSPDRHLGGLSSGGLGYTDSGNTRAIGSLAREFYRRVWKHSQSPGAWPWQPRESFAKLGQGVKQSDVGDHSMWLFEPHVAETIFDQWLEEHGVEVVRGGLLDRGKGVEMEPRNGSDAGPRIVAITTLAGPSGPARRFAGKVFIDATYEGDLMAAAGVKYHVGREAQSVYGEEWNGNQVGILHHIHHWKTSVDPFKQPANPASGLLPLVSPDRRADVARATTGCRPTASACVLPTTLKTACRLRNLPGMTRACMSC